MPRPQYTPIQPVTGGLVHAVSLRKPGRTACNRRCRGWRIVSAVLRAGKLIAPRLTCSACENAILGVVR